MSSRNYDWLLFQGKIPGGNSVCRIGLALATFFLAAQFGVGQESKPAPPAAPSIDFAHDVYPILKANCAQCHSNGVFKGGLSLETRAKLLESGAVEIGSHQNSGLVDRITSRDPDEQMPPEGKRLTEAQVQTIKRWIDSGLVWPVEVTLANPAFRRPLALKKIQIDSDNVHPLDQLINDYFEQNKIEPPKRLTDSQFIRRATLDLVGLLPTPSEIQQFVASEAPLKHQELIDDLLTRDRMYADHWMTFWNDHLRNDYVGTGYIDGGRKQITTWLHRALMENKPYDQFVRELIDPSPESAGFIKGIKWRGRVNASQIEPLQFSQNISQVFLGINMKCASCHDSFIDDWKLTDAYGLAAIISDEPLEMFRCDVPTGEMASSKFVFPSVGEIDQSLSRTQRLAQLAKLITAEPNGRFARTIVNRIWHRLMGRGLVHPVDVMANEAWSEPLLDYLALDLVNNGYDLKQTMRLIATSQVYQSRTVSSDPKSNDEFRFRGIEAKRMTAEQFVDAVWGLTGSAPQDVKADVFLPGAAPTGKWVWTASDFESAAAGDVVTFKYEFDVSKPIRGGVVVTCDNAFVMFLNGITVGQGDDWTRPKLIDLTKDLHDGNNILLIRAANGGGGPNPAALFLEGSVVTENGEPKLEILSQSLQWVREKIDHQKPIPNELDWQPAVVIGDTHQEYPSAEQAIRSSVAQLNSEGQILVRASLVESDLLMRSLGRPNREQVVTTRPEQLSTLQALDLSNGEILTNWLRAGAKKWLNAKHQNQWSDQELVSEVFQTSLSRIPSAKELGVLTPLESSTDSQHESEPIEDLLWMIVMLPEFQLIR